MAGSSLIDTASVPLDKELADLAAEVRPLDPNAAARLESLRVELSQLDEPTGWVGLDVMQAVDPQTVVDVYRTQPLRDASLARLERIRNILALCPILLTWLALVYASVGYRAAVDANRDLLTRPFLLLWEEGFQGLAPMPVALLGLLTLSHVALADVALLLAMLVLTWRIHSDVNVRQARREQQARALEGRLRHVAWRSSLALARRTAPETRLDQLRTVTEVLLDDLRAQRERAERLRVEREREVEGLRIFSGAITLGAQDLLRYSGEVRAALDGMSMVAERLEQRVAQLADRDALVEEAVVEVSSGVESLRHGLRQGLQDIQRELLGGIEAIAAAMDNSTARLAHEAEELRGLQSSLGQELEGASTTIARSAEQATASAHSVADSIGRLCEEVGTLSKQLARERAAYETAAQAAAKSAEALYAALAGMAPFARHMDAGSERMVALLRALEDVSSRFVAAVDAQGAAGERLARAADEIRGSATVMATRSTAGSESLARASQELAGLNRSLAGLHSGFERSLEHILHFLQSVEKPVRRLERLKSDRRPRFRWFAWLQRRG